MVLPQLPNLICGGGCMGTLDALSDWERAFWIECGEAALDPRHRNTLGWDTLHLDANCVAKNDYFWV